MIKFFRKIRQTLLSENKFSKYLLYAIGEIALVVIGILIAIQLNSIKNKNEQRADEIIHLENLLSDLKQDKTELYNIIERRNSKSNSLEIIRNSYELQTVDNLNDYYSHLMNVLYWDAHNPSLLTLNELISSGKLSSLSNDDIKYSLLQIDFKYKELFEVRKHLYEDYWEYFYRPCADIIDYESAIVAWTEPDRDVELSGEFVEVMLKSNRIKNGFTLTNFNNNLLEGKLNEILMVVDSTIVMVEQEIER
jgi:hypothetical protein